MPLPTGEHQALGGTVFIIVGIRASWDQWSCLIPQMPQVSWWRHLVQSTVVVVVQLPSCVHLFVTLWTPGLPVPHRLLKFAQVHVHCISVAIQPSHPLMPFSSALNLSQHQGLFLDESLNRLLVSINSWLMFTSINYDVLILYEREWKMMTEKTTLVFDSCIILTRVSEN